jgi:hypothetical protein
MPLFDEAAREAAMARAWATYSDPPDMCPIKIRVEAAACGALDAAVAALPERSKAILALVELTDEELVERVARWFVGDCDGLSKLNPLCNWPATDGQVALARQEARDVLAALGLPVAEQKGTG